MLDNCEHVVEPVAALAGRLLRAAPGLRILATSREPLGVRGRGAVRGPPLEVPRRRDAEPRASRGRGCSWSGPRRPRPGFVLDADTAPAVAAICRRLDGIPLALELAASRVRALGVHAACWTGSTTGSGCSPAGRAARPRGSAPCAR